MFINCNFLSSLFVLNKVMGLELRVFLPFIFKWINLFPWIHPSCVFPTEPSLPHHHPAFLSLGRAVGIHDFGVKYPPWTLFLQSHPYPCPCSSLLHIPVVTGRCQSAKSWNFVSQQGSAGGVSLGIIWLKSVPVVESWSH